MAKSGAYWRVSPTAMGRAVTSAVQEKTSKSAKELYDIVVDLSPTDSGAYRASWRISTGQPVYVFDEVAHRALAGKGSPLPAVSRPRLTTAPFTKFYVSNGAPYAYRIENGWSDQAPQGVVRRAIQYLNHK